MKMYKFKAWNWAARLAAGIAGTPAYEGPVMVFEKAFPSAYAADRYATRINTSSGYTVLVQYGEEYLYR